MNCIFEHNEYQIYTFPFYMPKGNANMYVLVHNGGAIIIDPNESPEAAELLKRNRITSIIMLLTHEHIDHISGVNFFREQFESTVICSASCGERIQSPSKNHALFWEPLYELSDESYSSAIRIDPAYSCLADQVFCEESSFEYYGHYIYMRETPGHSPGSICIVLDNKLLFTGDSLIPGMKAVTRLPGGNKNLYNLKTRPYLLSLPGDMIVFPGHGDTKELKYLTWELE